MVLQYRFTKKRKDRNLAFWKSGQVKKSFNERLDIAGTALLLLKITCKKVATNQRSWSAVGVERPFTKVQGLKCKL